MLNLFRPPGSFGAASHGLSGKNSSTKSSSSGGWQWNLRIHREDAAHAPSEPTVASTVRSTKMARLEAVFMVADGPLSLRKLSQFATLADNNEAKQLIEQLNQAYEHVGSAFRIERVATGHQLLTQRRFAFWLDRLHQRQASLKLSAAAMETLTIVAYRQPITRADVEAIRGVQSSEMLKQLLERKLVRVAGEDDSLGRPYLYGTTRQFLEIFGVHSLSDLPMADALLQSSKDKQLERQEAAAAAEELDAEADDYDEDDEEDYDEDDYDDEEDEDGDDEVIAELEADESDSSVQDDQLTDDSSEVAAEIQENDDEEDYDDEDDEDEEDDEDFDEEDFEEAA